MCKRRDRESEYGKDTQGHTQAARLGKPAHERRAHQEAAIARCGHGRNSMSSTMARAARCRSENERRYGCHAKADQSEGQHGEANMLNPQRRSERECAHHVRATEQAHGTPLDHQAIAGKTHAGHRQ
jgi:hypothetical protein